LNEEENNNEGKHCETFYKNYKLIEKIQAFERDFKILFCSPSDGNSINPFTNEYENIKASEYCIFDRDYCLK